MNDLKKFGLGQKIFLVIVVVAVLLAGFFFFNQEASAPSSEDEQGDVAQDINSFSECAEAGYPIMESYPRRCATPDGETFVEEVAEVSYDNASEDLIRVELPYPGAVVGKEFRVVGEARGYWYFEASFPIEVIGQNGNVIGGTHATAEGDWMTEDFVPFMSETIDLPSAYTGPATLVLKRSNASGLPENDASISIPIVVEY